MKENYYQPRSHAVLFFNLMRATRAAVSAAMLLLVFGFSEASAQGLTLDIKGQPIRSVFKTIEQQSDYVFLFEHDLSKDLDKSVTLSFKSATISEALDQLFRSTELTYKISGKQVLVTKVQAPAPSRIPITGNVGDGDGKKLAGASLHLKSNPKITAITNENGDFSMMVPSLDGALVITYVGMEPTEIMLRQSVSAYTVTMSPKVADVGEVVIHTGMFQRDKISYTGATATLTGIELKSVGNHNIVESIKTLDPSFVVLDNNLTGSNPNAMPDIEIRGKTSISIAAATAQYNSDPNQPLFILDGFETTLQVVNDLDMNRVASVTLLKDAGSTAIYGAKAANGVVVIETIKPTAGHVKITYNGDFLFDVPDLTSYNMMNAREKLEFELRSGRYTYGSVNTDGNLKQMALDQMYNSLLANINRGVDTYWLSVPVRTGFTNAHSIQFSGGGSEGLLFNAGLNYKNIEGAMKGSGRTSWGGNMEIIYRTSKINVSNRLFLSGYDSNESPYGSFSNFVNANPYYEKYDANGNVGRYLATGLTNMIVTGVNVPNPLYNAMLSSYNRGNNLTIRDNLQATWNISREFSLRGSLNISKSTNTTTKYVDARDTSFDGKTSDSDKGTYSETDGKNYSYLGNVMITYAKVINRHSVTANLRSEIEQTSANLIGFDLVGFSPASNGNPRFYTKYNNDIPLTYDNRPYRRVNFLGSVNYSYDLRYLLDLNYRLDGSTGFGRNSRYSPFWSVGVGWNAYKEKFLSGAKWLTMLKIWGNYGLTGNQNFGSTFPVNVYSYQTQSNKFGNSVTLTSLGNPYLKWQNTTQLSFGVDLGVSRRLNASLSFYTKNTDPLVAPVDQAPSTGASNVYQNLGSLFTKGFEFDVRYSPIYRPKSNIIWTIRAMGSMTESKYRNFDNRVANINNDMYLNRSLVRYMNGYSPTDIWAVQSLGIDPATGNEIFVKQDGTRTFTYDPKDIVKVGNTAPAVYGVFGTNLLYKNFTFAVNFRYSFGGQLFNSALFNKVENISFQKMATQNQDVRALYNRWYRTGDVSQFVDIRKTGTNYMSSRFVQNQNYVYCESMSAGYQFDKRSWIRHLKLESLRLNAYANDLFRVSSVLAERGIDYPFTRSFSLGIGLTF